MDAIKFDQIGQLKTRVHALELQVAALEKENGVLMEQSHHRGEWVIRLAHERDAIKADAEAQGAVCATICLHPKASVDVNTCKLCGDTVVSLNPEWRSGIGTGRRDP